MKILVSGLLNIETTSKVRGFPINYYPIDYNFFGITTDVSGVGFNIAKALKTLNDEIVLTSIVGNDFETKYIIDTLKDLNIPTDNLKNKLEKTPSSVVLYDDSGKRQIYCDLKDIQETKYEFKEEQLKDVDMVVACNINFNRELLHLAKKLNIKIVTDVHVIGNIEDEYNKEFMEFADIIFLSDENIGPNYHDFIFSIANRYHPEIIVLGRGSNGASLYERTTNMISDHPAIKLDYIKNTIGAGDALFSSFIHFYHQGYDPTSSLYRAQIFAAHKIKTAGGSMGFITEEEINEWIKNH